jgi:DNA-binding transcriptional MerR regulator
MAGRSHLSIGEVLSLLQEEFPDVTISKIRFLESQGLVDPERTPSGYRKFYEQDIERLRWVLRQQRDAFLPLKVIKGRLGEQGEPLDDDMEEDAYANGYGQQLVVEEITIETFAVDLDGPAPEYPGPVNGRGLAAGEAGQGAGPGAGEGAAPARGGAKRPASGSRRREGRETAVGGGGAGAHGADGLGASPDAELTADVAAPGPGSAEDKMGQLFDTGPPFGSAGAPRLAPPAASRRPPRAGRAPGPEEVDQPAEEGLPPSPARRHPSNAGLEAPRRPGGGRAAGGGRVPAAGAGPQPAGAGEAMTASGQDEDELSLDELLRQADVDVDTVRDLERFGLINPKTVAGVDYYSADAALITALAGAFARHGVEARHLRAYKGAVEREAGLVQQVIMPLIRQRNPEARQAAADAIDELSHLGGELRSALLRSALSDLR